MGRHIPHVYVARPWEAGDLLLTDGQARHLTRVVRLRDGDGVSYTDGEGLVGEGTIQANGIVRGNETTVGRPSAVSMAVAPLKATDRIRFIVEKLQELGVERLSWLSTDNGQCGPPSQSKTRAWAIGALEQSRGAWLIDVGGPVALDKIERAQLMASGGEATLDGHATICIGPEGGWSTEELRTRPGTVGLGPTVLRTETAALVAATLAATG